MAERVDRFVEWAIGSDCYVMVEVLYGGLVPHPKRRLWPPISERELRVQLLRVGLATAEVDRLLTEAQARATVGRLDGPAAGAAALAR